MLRLGAKSTQEATNTKAVLDEVAIYNRALSEMQVFALHEAAALGSDRIEAIAQRVAADDAETTRRIEQFRNEKRMAMVVGRTIGGWKDEVFGDSYGLPVPDRIDERQLEKADLSRYDVLLFPGGGGFDLTEAGAEALRQYLQDGGGFVGICAGCYAAGTYKLIEREFYPFRERGQVEVYLHEHPVTEGYHPRRQIALAHANGPLIQPGEEAEDILADRGILVLPDVIANAGGVIVSYFEWVQNASSFAWTEDAVNARLDRILSDAFAVIWREAHERKIPLRTAAFVIACSRILEARDMRGLYP